MPVRFRKALSCVWGARPPAKKAVFIGSSAEQPPRNRRPLTTVSPAWRKLDGASPWLLAAIVSDGDFPQSAAQNVDPTLGADKPCVHPRIEPKVHGLERCDQAVPRLPAANVRDVNEQAGETASSPKAIVALVPATRF